MVTPGNVPVLIVDDQAAFRAAARAVVALTDGFEVAAEAASGAQALDLADRAAGGLVLMDIHLGDTTGIEAARAVTAAHPSTVVLLMSTYTADDLPADARDCGAAGYVHKEDLGPDVLREAWAAHHPVA